MIEVKELVEENLADAEKVIRTRFGENGVAVVRAFMRNPVRKDWPAAGYLAFCDGIPQAFEGFTLRRMFLAGEPIVGKVGGLTCAVPGADETAYVEVRLQNNRSYAGCVVFFGNSQNANTAFLTRKYKNAHPGPESCSRYLWRAVRPLDCLAYFLRRKMLKKDIPDWPAFDTLRSRDFPGRVVEEFPSFFDRLTARYAASNEGLVCSRSGEEIDWLFGERIRDGRSVVLGTSDAEGPTGAIIVGSDRMARRFMIQDWIAVGNDLRTLEALLRLACRFVKNCTPAMMLETMGFPSFVQPLLKRYLPHERDAGNNFFSWACAKSLRERLEAVADTPKSWFFGPYDGDLVM